jgi:ArsR family transcriptional regulator
MQMKIKSDLKVKSQYYAALADPIRLNLLNILLKNKNCCCICELAKQLHRDQSVIFRHIQILKKINLINTKKEQKYLWCCIKDKQKVTQILEN